MAQYQWDFQNDTPGQPPAGWTLDRYYSGGVIVGEVSPDHTFVATATASGENPDCSLYLVPDDPLVINTPYPDVVFDFRVDGNPDIAEFGLAFRPNAGSYYGYLNINRNRIWLDGQTLPFDVQIGVRYWVHLWAEPGNMHVSIWPDGGEEPDSPMMTERISTSPNYSIPRLYMSVEQFTGTATIEITWIGVGSDGDLAPRPPVAPPSSWRKTVEGTVDIATKIEAAVNIATKIEATVDIATRIEGEVEL